MFVNKLNPVNKLETRNKKQKTWFVQLDKQLTKKWPSPAELLRVSSEIDLDVNNTKQAVLMITQILTGWNSLSGVFPKKCSVLQHQGLKTELQHTPDPRLVLDKFKHSYKILSRKNTWIHLPLHTDVPKTAYKTFLQKNQAIICQWSKAPPRHKLWTLSIWKI